MAYEKIQRQSLIVWLYSSKQLKQLRKFGNIHYVSRRMKYAVLYTDVTNTATTIANLEKLPFVRSVEESHMNEINMDFSLALADLDDNGDYMKALNQTGPSLEEISASFKQDFTISPKE
ncbi:YlbG family protein [Eremococcus coleocola]|uniref:UPF0298 protein HMPREF9257_0321 n=1 Tax=Eremococcus coleocola ACS-139-V-Col8 TaxID=908337 RepID=E4KNF9_9LACT|nr:YlbG family protein [Eremococcus coleocola]EFR31469.1 hypothetical protein HMPREF9257_0321 [Eremococcus coleocola ACS-139-V-Col8]